MDEILKQLREALEPLSAWARILEPDTPDSHPLPNTVPHITLTMAQAAGAMAEGRVAEGRARFERWLDDTIPNWRDLR